MTPTFSSFEHLVALIGLVVAIIAAAAAILMIAHHRTRRLLLGTLFLVLICAFVALWRASVRQSLSSPPIAAPTGPPFREVLSSPIPTTRNAISPSPQPPSEAQRSSPLAVAPSPSPYVTPSPRPTIAPVATVVKRPTPEPSPSPRLAGPHVVSIRGTGQVPGLSGRLNPILDSLSRTYLYADNIAIEGGKIQPVAFVVGRPFNVEDAAGTRFQLIVLSIDSNEASIQYRMHIPESGVNRYALRVRVYQQDTAEPIPGVQILAQFDDGTYQEATTTPSGSASIGNLKRDHVRVCAAHPAYPAFLREGHETDTPLNISLAPAEGTGSVIINSTGNIPGLDGRLNPILDDDNRMYLYANDIVIGDHLKQPAAFRLNVPFELRDAHGVRMRIELKAMKARSSLVEFKRLGVGSRPVIK